MSEYLKLKPATKYGPRAVICNELQPRMAFLYYNTAAAYVSIPISLNANVKSDKLHL